MKVHELIARLSACDPNQDVVVLGCDTTFHVLDVNIQTLTTDSFNPAAPRVVATVIVPVDGEWAYELANEES